MGYIKTQDNVIIISIIYLLYTKKESMKNMCNKFVVDESENKNCKIEIFICSIFY